MFTHSCDGQVHALLYKYEKRVLHSCRNWRWSRRSLLGIAIIYEVTTSRPGRQRAEKALGR